MKMEFDRTWLWSSSSRLIRDIINKSSFFLGIMACLLLFSTLEASAAEAKLSSRTGIVVTPRNFPNHNLEDVTDMFRLNADLGSFTVIRPDWSDSNRWDATQAMVALAGQRNLNSVIEFNPFKANALKGASLNPPKEVAGAADRRLTFSNPAVSEAYAKAVLEIAELKPPFLALATDVNLLALSDPTEFKAFVEVYRKLYTKIKQDSANTKIFVTFQWEAMHGKDKEANRKLIDAFRPNLDILAFSSDPRKLFEKQGPASLPTDYYSRIADYNTARAPVFVEVGWPSEGGSGEADQVTFIREVPRLMATLRPSMLAWTFLHDVKVLLFFTFRAGLISADGKPKPAYTAFRDLSNDRPPVPTEAAEATLGSAPRSKPSSASREPGHFGIYSAKLDGSDVKTIMTSEDREMTHPRVSPDGKRITLTRYNKRGWSGKATEEQGYENTEIVIANLDGTGLETIIPAKPGVIAANGCWTPDGKSLIFLSTDNPQRIPEIRQIDLATRKITRVPTPAGLKTTDPHWEGNKIVFPVKAEGKGADSLWVMNADGSGAQQVTRPTRSSRASGLYGDFDPKLSPDGSKVAFMRIDGGESWRVMVLDLTTGEERLLTPKGAMQWLPTWSSDGKLLLYVHVDRNKLKETGLYTMTIDGNDRKMIPLPRGYLYGHSSFFPNGGSSASARIIYTGTQKPGL